MNETTLTNVAKTLNVSVDVLREKAETILIEQGAAWENAGKSEEDCGLLALRVAARQISTESARMRRAGATQFEGMFIYSPRPKEWGKILYNKMSKQLRGISDEAKAALVDSGAVVLYENNHDGTYHRHARDDFGGMSDVSELPRHTMQLDENTHFYVVWDKNNATFPSGDANFKFGRPRPQDERERSSLFLTTDMKLITVKAQGNAADVQHPTFVTGTIPLKEGKNNNAYARPNVSVFSSDPALVEQYSGDPLTLLKEDNMPIDVLNSLDAMRAYYDEFNGKDGWWDKIIAVPTEVIHIDPRDNGGMVLVCADLDMTSTAATVDVYVSANQAERVNFAVGTKCLVVGQTWRSQEDEQRLSIGGWWAYDEIEAMPSLSNDNMTIEEEFN
jgi:hypothetical protein